MSEDGGDITGRKYANFDCAVSVLFRTQARIGFFLTRDARRETPLPDIRVAASLELASSAALRREWHKPQRPCYVTRASGRQISRREER
jgi:hypothetical protein